MAARHFQLVLRPRRFWLMLLSVAAAGVYCHCIYLGTSDRSPKGGNSSHASQTLFTHGIDYLYELSASLQDSTEKEEAPLAAEAATPYEDTNNISQAKPKSLFRDSFKATRIIASKLSDSLRRRPWAVLMVISCLMFLIITLLGKRSAMKKVERAIQKDLSKLSAKGEISKDLLPQGEKEDFDEEARNELLALQREEEAAKEILSLLERRQTDAEAQKAEEGANEKEAKELQQSRERLREAREARDRAKFELELANVMQDVRKGSPAACLARIIKEKEELMEQESCSLKGVTLADTFDVVKGAKEAQLAALTASLAKWRKEIAQMEDLITQRREIKEKEGFVDKKTPAAAEKEKEKAKIEGQGKKGVPPAPSLSEEEKAIAAKIAKTRKLVEESKAELEKLLKAQSGYAESTLLLKSLQKQLAEFQEEVTKLKAEVQEPEEEDEEGVKCLYPEERKLLEAEQKLRLLQYRKGDMVAEHALLSSRQDEALLLKTYYDFFTSRARVIDDKKSETEAQQMSPEDMTAAWEERIQLAEEELMKLETERKQLEGKRERRKVLAGLLADLKADIGEAQAKVTLYQKRATKLPAIRTQRLRSPSAYALARSLTLNARFYNMANLAEELEALNAKVAQTINKEQAQGLAMRRYWDKFGAPTTDDFITSCTEVCSIGNSLRMGERLARDELTVYKTVEALQKHTPEELFQVFIEEMAHPLFKSYVTREWATLQSEKRVRKGKIEKLEEEVEQLREKLTNLAHAQWWTPQFPQQQLHAYAYIIKQEHALQFHKDMLERLEKVTEESLKAKTKDTFFKAAWTARKRRKLYGTDPEVLASISNAYEMAIFREEGKMQSFLDVVKKIEARYEATPDLKNLPPFAPRTDPSQGTLEKVLLKDVLQLRKKKKKSKDSKDSKDSS